MALNYRLLAKAAKTAVDKRGGSDALKQDLAKLQEIAKGQGSVATKAGKAAAALKTPPAKDAPTDPADTGPA
jgi:hypothetical protein